ncbi:MAG: hypothetical protein HGB26_02250 [Desulfobulbaceae bacterium]|nr:hypothetical protein [Desulfobulbaceae bacterium]
MYQNSEAVIINFILLMIGGSFLLWGIFCFLGGPDGAVGSKDSLSYGAGNVGIGSVLLYLRALIQKTFTQKSKDN